MAVGKLKKGTKITVAIISIICVVAVAFGCFAAFYTPTVTFDAGELTGSVTSGASGYLYGVAEDGVPSYEMAQSLDVSSASVKTAGGLQHPIGDVNNVANELLSGGSCDYLVVYLQDMFSTWYYEENNINEMKQNGTYNWKTFLENEYFPLVAQTVNEIKNSSYAQSVVYCPYNECDNGVWFGTWKSGKNSFDNEGKQNFYQAWKLTCDYIKSLDPNAKIGGPGYYEYDKNKIDGFLEYTSQNNCNPDVLIYHELNYRAIYDWQYNVNELNEIEKKHGLDTATPVIVTEYGMMEDNGNPNTMLKYISQIENSKVYANQAYWLVANNFCNTCADYNTPNSAWWVYRWYAQMSGQTMAVNVKDVFHSDLGKAIIQARKPRYRSFLGLGTVDNELGKINLLVSGADYKGKVRIDNTDTTGLYGKTVNVKITAVTYQGISGKVYQPETVKSYNDFCGNSIEIPMDDMNANTAYHIEITESTETDFTDYTNDNLYTRYEFEQGKLLGNSYTYDSAYASTGDEKGIVGGMENDGDGVEVEINVPESGSYELKFIYGNSNDGAYDENGKQNANDRTYSTVNLQIDGNEQVLSLENTIKSEITNSYNVFCDLDAGKHKVRVTHKTGTIVLDSLLVRKQEANEIQVLPIDGLGYYIVAPSNGYYDINTISNEIITLGLNEDAVVYADENGRATAYLKEGLNYVKCQRNIDSCIPSVTSQIDGTEVTVNAAEFGLSGSASLEKNNDVSYVSNITSADGSALISVNAEKAGNYALTITYSNNDENGVHDYNVDLVEDYVSISVNGNLQKELYCRNTYSWDTFKTVTTNITLEQGENTVLLFNDGFNSFNGEESKAPYISSVTFNSYSCENELS